MLLPNTHPEFFTRWVFIFGREVIFKSNDHPLVSGFYRLLTIAMRISEKQNYFSEVESDRPSNEEENPTDMQTDEKDQKQNARASYVLFSKFIKVSNTCA